MVKKDEYTWLINCRRTSHSERSTCC